MNVLICAAFAFLLSVSDAAPAKRSSVFSTFPWSYNAMTQGELGPSLWWESSIICDGREQSPINLEESIAEEYCFGDIVLTGFGDDPPEGASMTLSNTGHYVEMHLTGDYLVDGGGLAATYHADQFHFHWGKEDWRGSEHYKDSRPHPAEMHIVTHDSSRFSTQDEATGQDGGLAVFAWLVVIQDEDNAAFNTFMDLFQDVSMDGDNHPMDEPINIENLLPADRSVFFRYDGSLTTPPCSEGVIWTNFNATIGLSEGQLMRFRNLKDDLDLKMEDNFRPIQPINERTLYINKC